MFSQRAGVRDADMPPFSRLPDHGEADKISRRQCWVGGDNCSGGDSDMMRIIGNTMTMAAGDCG